MSSTSKLPEPRTPELSKHIADKYKLKGLVPGVVRKAGENFDLTTISLKDAERLIKLGFSNLVSK